MLEDYIKAEGYTITTFYKELREASDRDPDGCEAILGQIVLAASDFDVFIQMCVHLYSAQVSSRSIHLFRAGCVTTSYSNYDHANTSDDTAGVVRWLPNFWLGNSSVAWSAVVATYRFAACRVLW